MDQMLMFMGHGACCISDAEVSHERSWEPHETSVGTGWRGEAANCGYLRLTYEASFRFTKRLVSLDSSARYSQECVISMQKIE